MNDRSPSDNPDDRDRDSHWFEPLADHMGAAYLRYSFTKGTAQEIDFLVDALGIEPGQRVLDVGCGPGRHAYELARRGISVHGIDISERFIELATAGAPAGATFARADARSLKFDGEFDVVICLCQGAFGLMTAEGHDASVIAGMSRAIRAGGRLALSAFSSYFVVKHFDAAAAGGGGFDAATGVNHEVTEVRNEAGEPIPAELWTGCYTPRELALLAAAHGLRVDSISSVEPGSYRLEPPSVETAEFLLLATKPAVAPPTD